MNSKKTYISVMSCIAIVLSFIIFIPSSASAALTGRYDCLPAVLMLRGSGEPVKPGLTSYSKTNGITETKYFETSGSEGDIISRLLQNFANQADPIKSVSKVRFVDINYPALDVPFLGDNPTILDSLEGTIGAYENSYRLGASQIVDFINGDEKRGCETQYMLVGYSQGVLSVRLSMNLLGENINKIASTYVIGDPAQAPLRSFGSNQITTANTSPFTPGVMIDALTTGGILSNAVAPIQTLTLQALLTEIQMSDSIIYRNDANIPSRVLCHYADPTCGFRFSFDITPHLSYFDENSEEGRKDIEHEVSEFNKQVELLALSAKPNPVPRALTSSYAYESTQITYNLVGPKHENDICSWDINSDGSYEYQNSCESYTIPVNTSPDDNNIRKMTVKLTDWLGQDNFYTKNQPVAPTIDFESMRQVTKLDPNSWYQIHPSSNSEKCLTVEQPIDTNIRFDAYIKENDCRTKNPTTTNEVLEASTQAFMPTQLIDSYNEKYTDFKWGYDDNYSISFSDDNQRYEVNNDTGWRFKPEFVKAENNILYYRFKHWSKCAYIENGYLKESSLCGPNSLFSFTNVTNPYFGALSTERDTQIPSDVTNIQWTNITGNSATLTWDPAIDLRNNLENNDVSYRIYTDETIPGRSSWFTTENNFYEMDYNTWGLFQGKNIIIDVVDRKSNNDGFENISSGVSTYFRAPNISQQPKPQLNSVEFTQNYSAIKINLPYDNENPDLMTEHINIYRNGNLYDITYGTEYTDTDIELGQTYTYAYQLVRSTGQVSDISESLVVYTVDNIAPSQPGNFFGPMWKKYGEAVDLTWNHSTDNVTSTANMRYDVYRNDIKITDTPISTNSYSDLHAPSGFNKYYVKAIDEAGNTSRSVNTSYVEVSKPATPPPVTPGVTKPIATADTVGLQNVSLSITSTDNGIASYNIYRNGQFYENTYYSIYWDGSVNPGATYDYQVETVLNDGTISPKSDVVTVQIPYAPEMEVNNLHTIYNAANTVYIGWDTNEPSYVQQYNIYRNGEYVGTTSEPYFIDKTVEPETLYSYTIELQDIWGMLAFSSPYEITTISTPTGDDQTAPSMFDVKSNGSYYTSNELRLKWSESVDDVSSVTYNVYRNNVLIATTSETEFSDITIEAGNAYDYMIEAVDESGNTKGANTIYRIWV